MHHSELERMMTFALKRHLDYFYAFMIISTLKKYNHWQCRTHLKWNTSIFKVSVTLLKGKTLFTKGRETYSFRSTEMTLGYQHARISKHRIISPKIFSLNYSVSMTCSKIERKHKSMHMICICVQLSVDNLESTKLDFHQQSRLRPTFILSHKIIYQIIH